MSGPIPRAIMQSAADIGADLTGWRKVLGLTAD